MRALVLGGDGFLGSHTVDRLVALGHEVTVFDRFPGGAPRHLRHHGDRIRLVQGEFGDTPELGEVVRDQEIVYQFICATTPGSSWEKPILELDGNLRPTLEFLSLAAKAGVCKIVFPSSGGTVYGCAREGKPLSEDTPPRPVTPYGIGKLAVEGFLHHLKVSAGIACDIYRIANAYGPRQPRVGSQGVIGVWLEKIRCGDAIEIFGDDKARRDYVFVEDVAELMALSTEDSGSSGLYNLGTGLGTSLGELVEILRRVAPTGFEVTRHRSRGFDAGSVVLDPKALRVRVPEFSFTRLEDGVRKTWLALQENGT